MASPNDLRHQFLVELIGEAEGAVHALDQELKWGSRIEWDTFRKLLRRLYQHNFSLSSFDHNCDYFTCFKDNFEKLLFKILTLFHTHKCSNISVIADVAELLCSVSCKYPCECIRFGENSNQTSMSKFEMILVFPYRYNTSLVHTKSEHIYSSAKNWVGFLATSGKPRVLQTIISFGATLIVPQVQICEVMEVGIIMSQLFKPMETSAEEIMSFEFRIRQNYKSKFNNYSRKRHYLLRMVLCIIGQPDFHTKHEEYIECARILVNSTPEPLITSEEFRTFLSELCSYMVSNDKLLLFMEKYKSLFPESSEGSAPRSLMHLSRFQVRENLRTARSFPHGLKLLSVPKMIKDYIRLKEICLM